MSDYDQMSDDLDVDMDAPSSSPSQQDPTNTTTTEEDDDPIVATYSVFIKPSLPKHRKLVVLDYVNRTAPDPSQLQQPRVLGLRIKPSTGMYEVDIPIETSDNYDRNKGIAWGVALQKSMEAKKGGSLGLAGGFGVGAPSAARGGGRRGGGAANNNEDETPLTWTEATRLDKVLRKQTLGGGRKSEEENTKHMVGVVQGKNIHLTPASSVVHLRPVAHHLDAAAEQERLSRPQPGGPSGAGGPGGAGGDKSAAGRAIHMTLKAAMDDGSGVTQETMADRLRAVQKEAWRSMKYVNDESDAAWEAYNECLLLRSSGNHRATKQEDKGKGKEVATDDDDNKDIGGGDDSGSPDLVERVPHLKTDWVEDDLLRAMSGIGKDDKKPGEEAVALSESQAKFAAKLAAAAAASKEKGKGKAPATTATTEPAAQEAPVSPTTKRRGRPARGGAAAARGSRAAASKAGSSSVNAMRID